MQFNRRRVMVLLTIVFVVVLSFFAGRFTGVHGHKDYIQPGSQSTTQQPGSDRVGIPPDSLAP